MRGTSPESTGQRELALRAGRGPGGTCAWCRLTFPTTRELLVHCDLGHPPPGTRGARPLGPRASTKAA